MTSLVQVPCAGAPVRPLNLRVVPLADAVAALPGSGELLRPPSWAVEDAGWEPSAVAWQEEERIVGAVLVLRRYVPGTRRFLGWLPRRPQLPPALDAESLAWLAAVSAALRAEGAFAVRLRAVPG